MASGSKEQRAGLPAREFKMRRRFFARAAALACATLAAMTCGSGAAERATKSSTTAKSTSATTSQSVEAAGLVRQALAAEAQGNTDEREEYLRQARAADSDYAPAHWQAGEVKIGDEWLPADTAAAQNAWSGKFVQYRQMRDQAAPTAEAQMKLAHWCEEAGLKDQERQHLTAALRLRPSKNHQRDATSKLGLVRYRKTLMPAATAEALKAQTKEAEVALAQWKPLLTRLRGDLESRDKNRQAAAAEHLKSIETVAAIPALETVFAKATPEAGKAAIAALAAMPQQQATDSLVRHAVLARHEEVRKAAAEGLRSRDAFSYIPVLLSAMHSPIEINFQFGMVEGGALQERLSLYQEDQFLNRSFVSTALTESRSPFVPNIQIGRPRPDETIRLVAPSGDRQIEATLKQAEADARTAQAAALANAQQQELNTRIAEVLRTTTDNHDFADDPKSWWRWWTEYNETHYGPKETYEQNRYSFTRIPDAYTITGHSCFVPGTPVWTVTGTLPIEKVHVGDWVLAQDVETGELAYKPVAATTMGPPLPLVEIRAGGETIRSTLGHLFWVSGTGWRMAKELAAGDRLHTTKGTLTVESAEQTGEASCHNLIVPDFNTYFVTDQQILVHDINIRRPTTAKVPGLVEQ
jgi:Pretoxin HINT domain